MSDVHPGSNEPVSILYKYPHILTEKSYLPLTWLEKHWKTEVSLEAAEPLVQV